jgi:hypothetical protein
MKEREMQTRSREKMGSEGALDLAKVAIYVEDTFDKANPDQQQLHIMEQAAKDLGNAGFGTVILAFLHVHEKGELYYNNIPLAGTLTFLPKMVKTIKQSKNVSRVLFSIGGGDQETDYQHIQQNLQAFKANLSTLATQVGLDGLDLDLEADNYDPYEDLLIDLVQWGATQKSPLTMTAAPYEADPFWVNVLKRLSKEPTKGQFAWWNLQIYGGADYGEWVGEIKQWISNPESFLIPGYNIDGMTPDNLFEMLKDLHKTYPGLSGSFIWKYESISAGYQASDFAKAIKKALSEQKTNKDAS